MLSATKKLIKQSLCQHLAKIGTERRTFMDYLISFAVSVMADIAAYIVTK